MSIYGPITLQYIQVIRFRKFLLLKQIFHMKGNLYLLQKQFSISQISFVFHVKNNIFSYYHPYNIRICENVKFEQLLFVILTCKCNNILQWIIKYKSWHKRSPGILNRLGLVIYLEFKLVIHEKFSKKVKSNFRCIESETYYNHIKLKVLQYISFRWSF